MKKALVIGIDDYPAHPLHGCVNDATAIANTLEKDGDGSPNFSTRLLTSNEIEVSTATLNSAVSELFSGDAETALLFFAGHGILNPDTNAGYIVSQNGTRGAWGMSLAEILGLANRAYPRIKSTVIILDSCHSGFAGEVPSLGNENISAIGSGVTILTACHRNGTAAEANGRGLFTDILLDALSGSAADICGRITPASVYAHVDQTLGAWEQRPIYKANVQTFITLRRVTPKISLETLRRLPEYFPDAASVFALDPSFEPDRENVPDELKHIPVDENNARVFKELQMCNRHGLVAPVDAEHMYYAAIGSTGCRLTALGAHYRKLAEMKRI
ncbi:peptidase C14 caspase catalytic subunit p20 [Cupriavidus basilensis OR16]|uniref:Peptidase C14 caspase catalytic subunit p20 n=1 Tax=Cupriavidus basilensis OR16 TaxID=1127483 RepID=H1S011_9BURK|nr:caspase family protein [Cupriavidus basilensis]EHP44227.1 peptidase C14 caspase catalytic subunit p20 [Cupriavidus basilensis OR16]